MAGNDPKLALPKPSHVLPSVKYCIQGHNLDFLGSATNDRLRLDPWACTLPILSSIPVMQTARVPETAESLAMKLKPNNEVLQVRSCSSEGISKV